MASPEDTGSVADVKPFLFVDHTRLLQTSLSKYFNKPLFSDITVIGPDGRKLLCHQVVLSAGSKRFANMLEQGTLANEELPVWGVDSDALQAIIEFFYSGECSLTFPNAVAVMDAANRLDVPSLSAAANTYVREALSVHTAVTILGHALQYKLSDLASSCLTIIHDKFSTVAGSREFTQASFDTLKRVLTHMQDTKGASEEDLFRAAWRWTLSDPSRSSVFDACLKIVPIPPTLSVKELMEASDPQGAGGMAAVGALLQAAATQAGSSQGGDPTSRSEQQAGGGSGDGGPGRDSRQGSQRAASGADAAAAAGARGSGLVVDVGAAVKQEKGASSAHNTSAAPQGTLSSFDPLSGQPTPTSKALTATMDAGGMFGGAADMAAAAAAAGLDPAAMAAQGAMDPQQYAAMYANGGAAGGAADGSASGAEGGAGAGSPGKMAAGWGGHMGMGQMGGMGMPGFVPGMPMMGMGPMMAPGGMMGGMMPGGYVSSGRNHAKGVCQVDGCNADLRGLRDYHLRYKICEYHLKVSSIVRDGVHQRFCQQCGRFHPLQDFDGAKRSCRARLLRHNARRRKRGEEELASMGYSSQQSAMKRGRGSFSQVADMEDTSGAAAAGGYWPMMPNMDPYMAMAMGGYNPDGSFNPAMMGQYAQYGMVSPTGAMVPNPSDLTGGAAAAGATGEGEGAGQGGSSAAASKRGAGSKGKGKGNGSEGDWEEGEEGEGGARDEGVAWAAAGLEMLADVAQARSSAAGDRSRAGSDAGSKPGAAAEGGATAEAAAADKQQQPAADAGDAQQAASSDSLTKQQEEQGAAEAATADPCSVAPLQLVDSQSPHAESAGGLLMGRSSPGHDAPRTAPGDAAAAGAGASGGAGGKRMGTPGAASGGAAAGAGEDRQQLAGTAGTSSSSPSNDLAFRADKKGAAAGTVKG